MTIYVVQYFYPGGEYAGIIGVYSSEAKADAAIIKHQDEYNDCRFTVTEANVE